MLSIGLMSGTSMDGIDAALIETDAKLTVKTLATESLTYPSYFQHLLKLAEKACFLAQGDLNATEKILDTLFSQHQNNKDLNQAFKKKFNCSVSFNAICQASTQLHIHLSKNLLAKTNIKSEQLDVVGYHGQTFFHNPDKKITVQVGDAKALANELKVTTVSDLRSRDVALGGQGAPLVPIYHHLLAVQHQLTPCIILNLGGIANITAITGNSLDDIISFDVGPANTLIDRYLRQKLSLQMDYDGELALTGKIIEPLLSELLNEKDTLAYRSKSAPKSLDSHHFHLPDHFFDEKYSAKDICATLVAFSCKLIIEAIDSLNIQANKVILCGGGAYNKAIINQLSKKFEQCTTAKELNWNNDSIEAECIAYIAARRIKKLNSTFPNTTGVKQAIPAGEITHYDEHI